MSDFSVKARVQFAPRSDAGRFITARIIPGLTQSIQAAQGLIVQEAKNLCPVRTGALRDSIAAVQPEETGKTVVGQVEASAPYSAYVEFGTGIRGATGPNPGPYPYSETWSGMEARAFMRPALDTTRDAVREIFASQLAISLKT